MYTLAAEARPGTRTSRWIWLPKPLFTAWVLGCVVSLLDSRGLTIGRVLPAALTWSWVPLLEILAFAAVWKLQPRPMPFAIAVDRFCAGNTFWWLLLVAFGACWRLLPESVWLVFAAGVAAWNAFSDYRFFQREMKSAAPLRDLLINRVLAWVPGILLFGGASLWPGIAERLQ
jgi:hypothetical protein